MVKIWYYSITTLSTIGFGDFSPKSVLEKIVGSVVLLFGVVVFGIIMNRLIEILLYFKSIDGETEDTDLAKWIAMLSKYNGGQPMDKDVITKIEDFFQYYWSNNKMQCFKSETDKRFIGELPGEVSEEIYIDYVFQDFVYKFQNLCRYKNLKG